MTMIDLTPGAEQPPTRQKIILALKHHGSMTAAELGDLLGMSSMGARRHLDALAREEWVRFEVVQRGKGAPSHLYQLAPRADELFPKKYAQLANELLGYLTAEQGDAVVSELFERRAQYRLRVARSQLDGLPLAERVAGLTALLRSDGYLAELQALESGGFLVTQHNCPVYDVAAAFRAACNSELGFVSALLPDAEVTREQCLVGGGQGCIYRITARQESST
jgi:predicted ArsR family transcriptional regulator